MPDAGCRRTTAEVCRYPVSGIRYHPSRRVVGCVLVDVSLREIAPIRDRIRGPNAQRHLEVDDLLLQCFTHRGVVELETLSALHHAVAVDRDVGRLRANLAVEALSDRHQQTADVRI